MLLAIPTTFLPVDWMAAVHRWLGLGDFPATPIVDYLTRSLSLLYALHGGVLIAVAADVRRYAPVIVYVGAAHALFGMVILGVDLHAGLPLHWTLGEGPPITVLGLVLLWLARAVDRE